MSANSVVGAEFAVLRLLAARVDSNLGKALVLCQNIEEYEEVISKVPVDESSPQSVSRDMLLKSYLKKVLTGGPSVERRVVATTESWHNAERRCAETNYRLNRVRRGSYADTLLSRAADIVRSVLGPLNVNRLLGRGRWSRGATFNTRRGTHYSAKMVAAKSVTPDAARLVPWFFQGFGSAPFNDFELVDGNKCIQVPKTFKINRMISSEPSANAFMQQAVGGFIRRRLKVVGVDLNDQTINQRGAFHALVDELATLDLSMASDTLSTSLVDYLLPPDWFDLLDSLRSKKSLLDGKWYVLNKFSSMGNAFTFELESLIFYALCSVVSDDKPIVYGDDIIVPQRSYPLVAEFLNFCGFEVNKEKSYSSGSRYFESCGKHYFDLEDVTPAYQKEALSGSGREIDLRLIRAHNRLVRWAVRNDAFCVVAEALRYLRSLSSNTAQKTGIPLCERDDGFIRHLSLLKVDANGDYRCLVLRTPVTFTRKGVVEEGSYRYKLYNPSQLNENPRGYSSAVQEWPRSAKAMRIRVWRSSVLDERAVTE